MEGDASFVSEWPAGWPTPSKVPWSCPRFDVPSDSAHEAWTARCQAETSQGLGRGDAAAEAAPADGFSIAGPTVELIQQLRTQRDPGLFEDSFAARMQYRRGVLRVEEAAAEATRRTGEIDQCLAEVQASVQWLSTSMRAAKKQQQQQQSTGRGRSAPVSQPVPAPPLIGLHSRAAIAEHPSMSSSARSWRSGAPAAPRSTEVPPRVDTAPCNGLYSSRLAPPLSARGGERPRPPQTAPPAAGRAPRAPMTSRCRSSGRPQCLRQTWQRASVQRSGKDEQSWPPQPEKPQSPLFSLGAASAPAPDDAASVKEALRAQLLSVRGYPEAEQRAVVKNLLVKWHPDRNADQVELATVIFQYIQQQKVDLLGI